MGNSVLLGVEEPGMELADDHWASLSIDSRYRLLVEAASGYAIYMLDPTGIVVSWNGGARRIKGYENWEIIGSHVSRFHTAEDRAAGAPERELEIAERTGKFEGEGWRQRKDGSLFWAHVLIDPIRDDTNRLIGFAKVTRDLTERKVAADALQRSEEQFKLLVQSVTDYAIYMLDAQGIITSWNVGAERLKGYRPDEIIGQHFSRFYTEEDKADNVPARGLRTAAAEGRFEKEGWRVRKDGSHFWGNVVIDPIRDEHGTLIGYAKVTRDFTERRDAQRILDEAREALFQSQKLEAIGRLTGGVAHDFNNLLMAILSSLELVRKRLPDDPRVAPLLRTAVLAAERGASLTERMLMFARRHELNPEHVEIPSLVLGMAGLLRRSLGPMFKIETQFPRALPRILVDPNQLESALLNLAVNARDAMPNGGTIVIAAAEKRAGPGEPSARSFVRLSVSDSGEGMDEETLGRAVEPFFTTKGVGKGTGLGLSMVQGLVVESHGQLILKSEKGMGTTAEMWLPVAEEVATEKSSAIGLEQPVLEQSAAARPLVVLAVDDDSLVLMNTEAMLEDIGHHALAVSSGPEALDVLRRRGTGVDLVITDQVMPRMTGVELAQQIRREWPALPVILATGYAELPADARVKLLKLSKPYLQSDLARAIDEAMA